MTGVETHTRMSDKKLRNLGWYIANVVTATIDPDGPKPGFEVTFILC